LEVASRGHNARVTLILGTMVIVLVIVFLMVTKAF
jgi:hypothetical protein